MKVLCDSLRKDGQDTDIVTKGRQRAITVSSFRRRLRRNNNIPLLQVLIVHFTIILVSLLPCTTSITSANNHWYTKYPAYPPYCSTPTEMKTRSIPPLAEDPKLGATRLVHVTSIIRHGARTPLSTCWVGTPNVQIIPWDCNLTTWVTTPSPQAIAVDEASSSSSSNPDAMPLSMLEKRYNALMDPKDDLSNQLNGTCQYGQLILPGYDQQITNGVYLRNAYVYDGTAYDHDERMRLIDVAAASSSKRNNNNNNIFTKENLWFRSDDDQRTVMSGQVLLQGMFGPEMMKYAKLSSNHQPPIISVHLADRHRDVVDPNNDLCPRLGELWDETVASSDYKAFDQSNEAVRLRNYMQQNLGFVMGSEAIDCLMTTICTDRPLPRAVDDYKRVLSNRTYWLQNETKTNHTNTTTSTTALPNGEVVPSETNVFQRIIDLVRLFLGNVVDI